MNDGYHDVSKPDHNGSSRELTDGGRAESTLRHLVPASRKTYEVNSGALQTNAPAWMGKEGNARSDFRQLVEHAKLLVSKKYQVIVPGIVGLLIAVCVGGYQPPLYRARASLEIQGLHEGFRSTWTADATQPYVQNQARLLRSRTLVGRTKSRVLTMTKLKTDSARMASLSDRRMFGLIPLTPITIEDAVDAAAGSLEVVSEPDHMILDLSCESPMPEVASGFVNALMEEYVAWNLEGRWNAYRQTSEWLARAQGVLKNRLETAEQNLLEYARGANLVLVPSDQGGGEESPSMSAGRLKNLQDSLSSAQADRILRESQLRIATVSPADSIPQVTGGVVSNHYEMQLAQLKSEMAELSAEFTPEHYRVKRLRAQIETLQASLEKEREAAINRLRTDYEAALHRETVLRSEYQKQAGLVSKESETLIQYNILKREVDISRQLYDAILRRSEEAGVDSALRATNSRVVDQAYPPASPYKPNQPLYWGIGLFGGLCLGAIFALAREHVDSRIKAPGEAGLYLDLRELGAIPTARLEQKLRIRNFNSRAITSKDNTKSDPGLIKSARSPARIDLITWTRKSSITAEAFRASLMSMLSGGGSWSGLHTVMVTSPGPREGKTSVVTNLAIALTELGNRTLLIDADLRRPRLHTIFALENERGLTTLLHPDNNSQAPKQYIQKTEIPGLSVLPTGPAISEAGSSLLYPPQFHDLLKRFGSDYDLILIDTAPVLSISDARVVGRFTDGVVMVVRSGQTTREAAAAAVQQLRDHGARVMGVILNDWNPRNAGTDYYYYDHHARV